MCFALQNSPDGQESISSQLLASNLPGETGTLMRRRRLHLPGTVGLWWLDGTEMFVNKTALVVFCDRSG
jgi:hypothetical protein